MIENEEEALWLALKPGDKVLAVANFTSLIDCLNKLTLGQYYTVSKVRKRAHHKDGLANHTARYAGVDIFLKDEPDQGCYRLCCDFEIPNMGTPLQQSLRRINVSFV